MSVLYVEGGICIVLEWPTNDIIKGVCWGGPHYPVCIPLLHTQADKQTDMQTSTVHTVQRYRTLPLEFRESAIVADYKTKLRKS